MLQICDEPPGRRLTVGHQWYGRGGGDPLGYFPTELAVSIYRMN